MSDARLISVIICTRNRAASLCQTLTSLAKLKRLASQKVEIIVVDNGSSDETPSVLAAARTQFPHSEYVVLTEPQPGKSKALNRAIAAARGEVLLFTDDDVRPPEDWIERMTHPILEGEADAVAGGIRLAAHLRRPWLGREQRAWLASTEDLPRDSFHPLIGANMALSKQVFTRIPGFDPEVGPGGIGHAEDTLLWLQVREAGYRVITRLEVEVEHHLDEDRLCWRAFAQQAKKRGEFAAYIDYHWNNIHRRHPHLALAYAWLRLWAMRLTHPASWRRMPIMPAWEMELLEQYHMRLHLLTERWRPRNYDRCGLIKRGYVEQEQ